MADALTNAEAAISAAPPPRANPLLLGHEAAERSVVEMLGSGRIAHAWLINGPAGIGKATFAFRFARYLLVEGSPERNAAPGPDLFVAADHPVFRRVASGGHADLLTVERKPDERRQRPRSDIIVDDVRTVGPFLASTPAEGGWRVVVVDGADAMTSSAANALLKVLEEPPDRAVLILTCGRLARVLPTIRSRCRRLDLAPLPTETMRALLGRYLPQLPAGEADLIVRHARGSIGAALHLAAESGLAVKDEVMRIMAGLPALDTAVLLKLADKVAAAEDDAPFRQAADGILDWLHDVVRVAAGAPPGHAIPSGHTAAAGRASLDRWLEVWDKTQHLLSQAGHANLDRRQVLLAAVFDVRAVLAG